MAGNAAKCDGCARIRYDVQSVALLVEGALRAERDLCAACRTNAIDGFLVAQDGLAIHRAKVVR